MTETLSGPIELLCTGSCRFNILPHFIDDTALGCEEDEAGPPREKSSDCERDCIEDSMSLRLYYLMPSELCPHGQVVNVQPW